MLNTNNDEPTNDSRASWAREAVLRYAEVTRHDAAYFDDIDCLTEATQYVFGDMLHLLCRHDVPLGPALLAAFSCFAEERDEEGESVPDVIDAVLATCAPPRVVDTRTGGIDDPDVCCGSEGCTSG